MARTALAPRGVSEVSPETNEKKIIPAKTKNHTTNRKKLPETKGTG
jgi:hypothetical protein